MSEAQLDTLSAVFDQFEEKTEDADEVEVGDLLDAIGTRAFGPLLLLPAIVLMTPAGGIPGVPTAMAILVGLVALQKLLGLDHPWMPGFLEKRSLDREKVTRSISKIRPVISKIDRVVKRRLSVLVDGPMRFVIAAIVLAVAIAIPPLELLPFATLVPGVAIFLFALAMIAKDGVVAILAFVIVAVLGTLAATTLF